MTRAYREWRDSGESVSSKARLFRILTREFFGFGAQKQRRRHSKSFHSEDIKVEAGREGGNPQNRMAAIRLSQLPLLTGISSVAVKGAIARLRPHSRLALILLYRERFSYADIAYIMDLSRDSVRTILSRLRRLLPGYILETAACVTETTESQPIDGEHGGAFDRLPSETSIKFSSVLPREVPTNTAAESWEDDGGAVVNQREG
jgi:DNA-directed RNA polymerase specialized sigma24 family protein